jgi:hypothetical protein
LERRLRRLGRRRRLHCPLLGRNWRHGASSSLPCGNSQVTLQVNERAHCPSCGKELATMDGRLAVIGPHFIGDWRIFTTKAGELTAPRHWKLPWPGRCCVCGDAATRTQDLHVRVMTGAFGPAIAPMAEFTTYTFSVSHCAKHPMGIEVSSSGKNNWSSGDRECYLEFRSFDYSTEFNAINANTPR